MVKKDTAVVRRLAGVGYESEILRSESLTSAASKNVNIHIEVTENVS
jgi:hypothetical protein